MINDQINEGRGTSVLSHPDWYQYEYNQLIRIKNHPERLPQGLFKTTMQLHSAESSNRDYIGEYEEDLGRRRIQEESAIRQQLKAQRAARGSALPWN
jgi:hypothetical protein